MAECPSDLERDHLLTLTIPSSFKYLCESETEESDGEEEEEEEEGGLTRWSFAGGV